MRILARCGAYLVALGTGVCACGTVDAGEDFQVADVVFDEGYYYCRVEPMLFASGCGSGDEGEDGRCHFNVTKFRLQAYAPPVSDGCSGVNPGSTAIPKSARDNYQAAQREMRTDPDLSPLLLRPTKQVSHPREIFEENSSQATIIREWATRYSSQ